MTQHPMRYQNLIHKKCPRCDQHLETLNLIFRCPDDVCGFTITRRGWADILLDESHVMRRFLTKHESETLENAIEELAKT